ncbi:sulfite exporter TauE/SafE family protein [Ancylobacter sp. TS-1]|uniref:sulfite exporter TauE/SafE family protein n=1 Tax=Ancylobacter sp. TS-1 TaxID=1850374 RepID=UPI001265C407|nr:sulfite exporter TauE/SafE family protein [Ancylobacter sp. TS-1]QFR33456.1 sulfite exporter TauE/SafE family protein [Ancylobacter sp. TS-1]
MVDLSFIGGLLLGLASSLHCAGMCGGIASGLLMAFDPGQGRAARLRVLLSSQLGRIASYVAAGGFLGYVGSGFYGAFDQAGAHLVLRWAAAVALGWIGLSMIGVAPALTFVDRLTGPLTRLMRPPGRLARTGGHAGPFLAGTAWGLLPCGMVYGALFYAMLAGSGGGGAVVMAGFGLGTLPSVMATAFGVTALRRAAFAPRIRVAAGLALILVATASALMPGAAWEALCLT